MPYTSFTPNTERFGFSTKGTFRCAHSWSRLFVIIGVLIIIGLAVTFFSLWAGLEDYFGYTVKITTYIAKPLEYGVQALAMAIVLYTDLLCIAAYIAVTTIIRSGQAYTFFANEEYFDICPPDNGRHTIIYYDDVINVMYSERRFPLTAAGLDVTVVTKKERFDFRFIHTPQSKNIGGITETPFNIIMERAGLVSPPSFNYSGR